MKYLVPFAACIVILAGLAACGGGDDGSSQEEVRKGAIGSLSEHVVDAWAANGPVAVWNVLHADVMAQCDQETYLEIMADEPQPTAWRNTKDITLQDLEHATATVVVVADGKDVEQPWKFEVEAGVRWRVTDAPGVQDCINS